MKRIFWLLAAAAVAITACNKPQYIIPIDDDDKQETPDDPDTGYKEKTFVVNLTFHKDVDTNYDGQVGSMPGAEILDFLGLTEEEFYKGFGTVTGSGSGGEADLQRSQENNTIMFGVANTNNTEDLKWIPASSGDCGQWFTKEGTVTYWNNDASWFFIENHNDWGLDSPDESALAEMWNWSVGFRSDHYDGTLTTYKATQVFFLVDDEDVERYAYVEWNLKVEEAQAVSLNVIKTQEITHTHEYLPGYGATSIQEEIDFDAVATAIGISADDATVYAINADGSVYPGAGTNFWFSIAGDVMGHGAGCGIDINKDAGYWTYCNYPDEKLAGQTLKGSIAFVNPANNNAYVVKVTVNLATIDYLIINQTVSYEDGDAMYTLTENNLAAIAAALGVESFTAAEIGTTYAIKGVNADDSLYDGDFTANNGYWYNREGNVTDWAAIEAAGYVGAFIEFDAQTGDFHCGFWEESGETCTVKLALVNGDKKAVLTFNLVVAEPAVFTTEEVGTMEASATQTIAAGYGGQTIVLDYDAICSTLGLTDEDFEAKFKITSTTGSVDYTAELPGGFWFNGDNEICGWSDVNSAYYLNFKYGEALEDASAGKLQIFTGIRNDNSTNQETGEPTHTCPPAGTYAGVVRMANIETMKHITLTVTLTITE